MCVLRSTISAVSAWLNLPFVLIVFSVFYFMLLWLINDLICQVRRVEHVKIHCLELKKGDWSVIAALRRGPFHSAGTFPDFQTVQNRPCRALLTVSMAHFNNSGGMSSAPAARPFFSLRIARWTSFRLGALSAMSASGNVVLAALSSS